MADLITADSVPVYGLMTSNVWGCYEWMTWHKALVAKYGKDKANQMFVPKWNDQSFWSTDYSWCKYDTAFADYMKSVGLASETGDIVSTIANPIQKVISSAGDVVENAGSTAAKTTKALSYVVPALVVVTGIGIIWYAYKTYLKTA